MSLLFVFDEEKSPVFSIVKFSQSKEDLTAKCFLIVEKPFR